VPCCVAGSGTTKLVSASTIVLASFYHRRPSKVQNSCTDWEGPLVGSLQQRRFGFHRQSPWHWEILKWRAYISKIAVECVGNNQILMIQTIWRLTSWSNNNFKVTTRNSSFLCTMIELFVTCGWSRTLTTHYREAGFLSSLRHFGHLSRNNIKTNRSSSHQPFQILWPNWLDFFGHFNNVLVCYRKITEKKQPWRDFLPLDSRRSLYCPSWCRRSCGFLARPSAKWLFF